MYQRKIYTSSLCLIAILALTPILSAQSLVYDSFPRDLEIIPRDLASNMGLIRVEGKETAGGFDQVRLIVQKDGIVVEDLTLDLSYSSGTANFAADFQIDAGLFDYTLDLYILQGATETLVKSASGLCAGDVFFINGQSNAEAKFYRGSANHNSNPFIRSFSRAFNWVEAEGDDSSAESFVGQWPLRMGRILTERLQVPIGIINHASGGRQIDFFARNDADPRDPSTNYGQALRRIEASNLQNKLRAIFWYQGEADKQASISIADYTNAFDKIYRAWGQDLGEVDRSYVFQIRQGCGSQTSSTVQEAQRRIDHTYDNIVLITTTGVDGHDGCHFSYPSGYETIGDRTAFLLEQDIYGSSSTSFFPPTIHSLFFSNADRSEITITTNRAGDRMLWESGSEIYFKFSDRSIFVVSGSVSGNSIILSLNRSAPGGISLTYEGHAGPGSWVTNEKGVGLATFQSIPISIDVANTADIVDAHFDIDLFPIPSTSSVDLKISGLNEAEFGLRVVDLLGRTTIDFGKKNLSNGTWKGSFDIGGLAIGSYFLVINTLGSVRHRKIIKK